MNHLVCHRVPPLALAWVFAWTALAPGLGSASEDAKDLPEEVTVTQTFDGRPFRYRVESQFEKGGYTIFRLNYPSPVETDLPQNNTVPADYYLPKDLRPDGPQRPAAICLHILDGDFELVRMLCSALASHGVPAIMFKLPYYGERAPAEGPRVMADKPQRFMEALSQGLQDVRRTVDLLASRPEVDPQHIGITGISLGGIVSASAAALEPRLSRAVLILAGGDVGYIIEHARETRELRETIAQLPAAQKAKLQEALAAVEPLTHAAGLRDRAKAGKVLMINAAEDEVVPPTCTEKLAAALGIADKVVWLDGLGHYTAMAALPRIMQTTATFFAADLPQGAEVQPGEVPPQTPLEIVAGLLKQVNTLLTFEPRPEHCHFVELEIAAGQPDETVHATVRFIRGTGNRFLLQARLPEIGEVLMGHGQDPWLCSSDKLVFTGTLRPDEAGDGPLAYVDPDYLVKARVVAGALAGVAIAPEVLEQFVSISDASPAGGPKKRFQNSITRLPRGETAGIAAGFETGSKTIHLESKKGGDSPRTARLVTSDDGRSPQSLQFDVEGIEAAVDFRGWQLNTAAHPGMFDPPAGVPVQKVGRKDLYRMFSAMFNFAMENVQ